MSAELLVASLCQPWWAAHPCEESVGEYRGGLGALSEVRKCFCLLFQLGQDQKLVGYGKKERLKKRIIKNDLHPPLSIVF